MQIYICGKTIFQNPVLEKANAEASPQHCKAPFFWNGAYRVLETSSSYVTYLEMYDESSEYSHVFLSGYGSYTAHHNG